MIGAFGPVVFEVSEKQVRTFDGLSRTEESRWAKHDVIGKKPVSEYIGPDLSSMSFTMFFSASLGVNPVTETDTLIRMSREGKAYPFVVGQKRFGVSKWVLKSVSVDFERVDNRGVITAASARVTLEEYV